MRMNDSLTQYLWDIDEAEEETLYFIHIIHSIIYLGALIAMVLEIRLL